MVGVAEYGLVDIPHEGGMTDEEAITFDDFPMNQRHCITGKNEVTCLERRGGTARVLEAYARAPDKEVILQ